MREIKFRMLVTTGDKPWHHWSFPQSIENCKTAFNHYNLDSWSQYTGLKDKNGKEIYEGDIVKHLNNDGTVGVVVFENGGFTVKETGRFKGIYSAIDDDGWEIIGNIMENPELLK